MAGDAFSELIELKVIKRSSKKVALSEISISFSASHSVNRSFAFALHKLTHILGVGRSKLMPTSFR